MEPELLWVTWLFLVVISGGYFSAGQRNTVWNLGDSGLGRRQSDVTHESCSQAAALPVKWFVLIDGLVLPLSFSVSSNINKYSKP